MSHAMSRSSVMCGVLAFLRDGDPAAIPNALMLLSENPCAVPPTAVLDRLWSVLFGLRSGRGGLAGAAPAHLLDCAFRAIMAADPGQDALRRMLATSERVEDICKTIRFVRARAGAPIFAF